MKYILVLAIFFISKHGFGQDTVITKKQKGFLFLSNYNYIYDWVGGESRPLGFHDFFFPIENFNPKLISDSNIQIVFKNGLRVDFINDRKLAKAKAKIIQCKDTSNCYKYNRFYIIPVLVDYKLFHDYEPYICDRDYYEIDVISGSKLRFEYLHKAIKPIKITPLIETRK